MAHPADPVEVRKTNYTVLSLDESGYWSPIGHADAHNANEAIRAQAKAPGTYIAIPSRSWRPTKVTVETQTLLKLDAA